MEGIKKTKKIMMLKKRERKWKEEGGKESRCTIAIYYRIQERRKRNKEKEREAGKVKSNINEKGKQTKNSKRYDNKMKKRKWQK